MKTLFPILSNLTMLALLGLVLVAIAERMLDLLLKAQVRRNLSAVGAGLIAPHTMKDYRRTYNERRAMRIIGAVLVGGIILSCGTLYVVRDRGLVPMEQSQANFPKRNELLARAEKMARFGNKGLMRANITHAKSVGPVSEDMVWRVEAMLAQ